MILIIFSEYLATNPPNELTSRRAKKIENTVRKVLRRNKIRRNHQEKNMTVLSNSIKPLANGTLDINSGNESIPFQNFVPPHYVTLEDLHKNHFNFSGKNGKLVKRKIRVKKLPAHLKGTRPTFVKLRYPNHLLQNLDNLTDYENLHGQNRTIEDKRCKF